MSKEPYGVQLVKKEYFDAKFPKEAQDDILDAMIADVRYNADVNLTYFKYSDQLKNYIVEHRYDVLEMYELSQSLHGASNAILAIVYGKDIKRLEFIENLKDQLAEL